MREQSGARVAVVGGGVVGLCSAIALSKDYDVTVIAERIGPASDSIKATAIWHVYLVPETVEILSWAAYTLRVLEELALNDPTAGVKLVPGIELFRDTQFTEPSWSGIARGYIPLTVEQIGAYNAVVPPDWTEAELSALRARPVRWGYRIEAPVADMGIYLSWLARIAGSNDVKVIQTRLNDLTELADHYQLIVNCSGFGARELARDNSFVPYKGQYFVLKASPSSPRWYVGDDDHPGGMAYAIPRLGEIMVGGCAERDREDLEFTLDWSDTMRRAGLYMPWLRSRSLTDQARPPVVGIRPSRYEGVRLEVDVETAQIPIIHNYGHGGSGFSLAWGCAEQVRTLAAFCLNPGKRGLTG